MSKERLNSDIQNKTCNRFYSTKDKSGWYIEGFPRAYSDKLLMISSITEQIEHDSFLIIKGSYLKNADVSPRNAFFKKVFDARKQFLPIPNIDLTNMYLCIKSFIDADFSNNPYLLLWLGHENGRSNTVHIGKVVNCTKKKLALIEVDLDGGFKDKPTLYNLDDIVYIGFGGPYEEALYLAGEEE